MMEKLMVAAALSVTAPESNTQTPCSSFVIQKSFTVDLPLLSTSSITLSSIRV